MQSKHMAAEPGRMSAKGTGKTHSTHRRGWWSLHDGLRRCTAQKTREAMQGVSQRAGRLRSQSAVSCSASSLGSTLSSSCRPTLLNAFVLLSRSQTLKRSWLKQQL